MTALVTAAIAFGVSAAVSGWFLVHATRARASGLLLLTGALAVLVASACTSFGASGVTASLSRTAGFLIVPTAVLLYPRVRWRDPLSFALLVVLVVSGLIASVWSASAEVLGYVIALTLLLGAWWSLEQADGNERRALTWSTLVWVVTGLGATTAAFLAESGDWMSFTDMGPGFVAAAALGPPGMAMGSLQREILDVRGLVTRAVVVATVLVTFVAVAIGVTALVEEVGGRSAATTPVIVLCAILAFGVRPLQVMLRGVVDQLLFGDRPDPLTAATSLADRIGDDPALALDMVREALVLPYASLRAGGISLAASGSEVTHTRTLTLRLGDDTFGEMVVGLRAGDLRLSRADDDVLRLVAPLLAQTMRARAMSRDLQTSREAVVTAVEEERRRLRRDLHDGLGPTLSGVAFATDAARNQLRSDPARADELLAELRAETTAAIAEIRRLVEGLRPPALDELGLAGAVRQHAGSLHRATGARLEVDLDLPAALPPLSAASEVAAFRIVVEALTNVARHAGATRAWVSVHAVGGQLRLSVDDDGRPTGPWAPGVGINSMRERAEQVGGSFTATPGPDGGHVAAVIPL
jgi:signal transduction histidine kinase